MKTLERTLAEAKKALEKALGGEATKLRSAEEVAKATWCADAIARVRAGGEL